MVRDKELKMIILDIEKMNRRINRHEQEGNTFVEQMYRQCKYCLIQAYIKNKNTTNKSKRNRRLTNRTWNEKKGEIKQ